MSPYSRISREGSLAPVGPVFPLVTVDLEPVARHIMTVNKSLYKGMPSHVVKLRESAKRNLREKQRREFKARQGGATRPGY